MIRVFDRVCLSRHQGQRQTGDTPQDPRRPTRGQVADDRLQLQSRDGVGLLQVDDSLDVGGARCDRGGGGRGGTAEMSSISLDSRLGETW